MRLLVPTPSGIPCVGSLCWDAIKRCATVPCAPNVRVITVRGQSGSYARAQVPCPSAHQVVTMSSLQPMERTADAAGGRRALAPATPARRGRRSAGRGGCRRWARTSRAQNGPFQSASAAPRCRAPCVVVHSLSYHRSSSYRMSSPASRLLAALAVIGVLLVPCSCGAATWYQAGYHMNKEREGTTHAWQRHHL
jgi:hypothetical protein